jgi:hypothetical protein
MEIIVWIIGLRSRYGAAASPTPRRVSPLTGLGTVPRCSIPPADAGGHTRCAAPRLAAATALQGHCPGGTSDTSPAMYRGVLRPQRRQGPGGTIEDEAHSVVPPGFDSWCGSGSRDESRGHFRRPLRGHGRPAGIFVAKCAHDEYLFTTSPETSRWTTTNAPNC